MFFSDRICTIASLCENGEDVLDRSNVPQAVIKILNIFCLMKRFVTNVIQARNYSFAIFAIHDDVGAAGTNKHGTGEFTFGPCFHGKPERAKPGVERMGKYSPA